MLGNPKNDVDAILTILFKYRCTNCARVASQLGTSRQALFRMIKNGTLQLPLFLKILDVLELKMDFQSESFDRILSMWDYNGPRIKKKIKGVVYDTNRFLTVGERHKNGAVEFVCYDPKQKVYLLVQADGDGQKSMRLIDDEELSLL